MFTVHNFVGWLIATVDTEEEAIEIVKDINGAVYQDNSWKFAQYP